MAVTAHVGNTMLKRLFGFLSVPAGDTLSPLPPIVGGGTPESGMTPRRRFRGAALAAFALVLAAFSLAPPEARSAVLISNLGQV